MKRSPTLPSCERSPVYARESAHAVKRLAFYFGGAARAFLFSTLKSLEHPHRQGNKGFYNKFDCQIRLQIPILILVDYDEIRLRRL